MDIVVVKGSPVNLFGRDAIAIVKLDWKEISFEFQNRVTLDSKSKVPSSVDFPDEFNNHRS